MLQNGNFYRFWVIKEKPTQRGDKNTYPFTSS